MSENEHLSENLDKQGFSPNFKNESSSSDEDKVKTKSISIHSKERE